MQTKLSYTKYDCYETVKKENIECPIDIEYSLPEYNQDIQKVLKCVPHANISSYSFTQDKFMCEGKLVLHVQYIDDKNSGIRVCEIEKEFSYAGDISCDGKTFGKVTASTGHIICRAISARKLDIHIPVYLNMVIYSNDEIHINNNAENLEKKTEKILVSHAVNSINETFTVDEIIKLPQSLPQIESVVRDDVKLISTKSYIENDKLIVDGVLDVTFVYRSFDGQIEKTQCSVEITQSFDCKGMSNELFIDSELNVCDFILQPKEDINGEYTVCDLFVKISACIFLYKDKEVDIITDAYSTQGKCEMKFNEISLNHLSEKYNERIVLNKNLFLSDDEIEKMIDCWCEDFSVSPYCEKNKITYRGKFNIAIIYKGKSNQIFSVTKNYDFTTSREFENLTVRKSDPKLEVSIKDYRIVDNNNIEFNCEAIVSSSEYECYSKKMLSSCELLDETECINKNCIKVYYGVKGESLWNIGKKYYIPVASIIESNKLTNDEYSTGDPLLIF